MALTAIKQVENRSSATVALSNRENAKVLGNLVSIPPGANLTVDMWIPWAPNGWDFPGKHIEVRLNDQPRFAVWQAAKSDGDFVRFSSDRAWHDPGERIFGIPEVNGFRTLRVMDRYCSLLPYALPVPFPWVTSITRVENWSDQVVTLVSTENPNSPVVQINPAQTAVVNLPIPWAGQDADFSTHHVRLSLNGQPRYWLWQAAGTDGDLVRYSSDGRWRDRGEPVQGVSGVNGRRTLVVNNNLCFQLVNPDPMGIPLQDPKQLGMVPHYLCEAQPTELRGGQVESVPKRTAVAFSVAGGPTDAFDRKQPGARFLYRDSGKRYEFRIGDNGVVVATHPDGRTTPLPRAISFARKRTGEEIAAPPFDLIAAGGGRVFAKAKGLNQFYFAMMDELFIQGGADGKESCVPSTYFKLDPEFNHPLAKVTDLTAHMRGCYGGHPAAERFPQLFWPVLEHNLMDMMVVRLDRAKWHQIDLRPPLNRMDATTLVFEATRQWSGFAKEPLYLQIQSGTYDAGQAPPGFVPSYPHVSHCVVGPLGPQPITLSSIKYERVLDIGVGHVHWHEQYHRVTGGEFQPMRTGGMLGPGMPPVTMLDMYRIANGPIRDGDGYIDGTCCYYILVQLRPDQNLPVSDGRVAGTQPDAFALLYTDEQFYFTQRWRLVHPEDHRGLKTALVKGLNDELTQDHRLYGWNPQTYWCPFRAGHIGLKSRLAVAAQVLLVTGGDPPDRDPAVIYSINFSYATMDRTWRWRALPATARYFDPTLERSAETIKTDMARSIYPETVRLRDDMTIHLKGTKDSVAGRWYQRYLPAGNLPVPSASGLVAGQRPREGYTHPWKFLPEAVFAQADHFSHFGVYDTVDSRTQYYPVQPASAADAQALAAGQTGAWVDEGGQLYVDAWKFPWHGGSLSWEAKRPPSLFEPVTRLRIVQRGSRWIAMHWDKRDDDLIPFTGLPKKVMLTNGAASARVTLGANVWHEEAPGVRRAHFWWEGTGTARQAAIAFTAPTIVNGQEIQNLWRVRMAALKLDPLNPTQPAQVKPLLNVETAGRFTRTATGHYEYRWTPAAADLPVLEEFCSATGEAKGACSIWFEDLVGHVSVPDELRWSPPPTMTVTVNPSSIPRNVPTQVTVTAVDVHTGANLKGTVAVDDTVVGSTGTPFSYVFTSRTEQIAEPVEDTSGTVVKPLTRTVTVDPVLSVSVPDYPDTHLTPHYYTPALRLRVEPSAIPIGQAVQVVVRADDASSGAPVAGRVAIAGRDVGATNSPFTYTFTVTPASAAVTATGYPSRTVAFSLYTPVSNAAYVGQSVPTSMFTGERYPVWVRMRNTGTTTWTAGGSNPFRLGSQNPQDNTLWGTNRQELTGSVAPNADAIFNFTVTAPPPGTYHFQWRMVHELVQWFGAYSPDTVVQVSGPTVQTSVTPYPVPLNQTLQVTIRATRNPGGALVAGDVLVNGTRVAATNTPFTYTFRRRLVSRTFDPEARIYVNEYAPPDVVVRAAGYPDAPVTMGF